MKMDDLIEIMYARMSVFVMITIYMKSTVCK